METQVIFSIIIPHKNSPDLLQRCLRSIPQREDIQIIIVDDNSDENIVDFENFPGTESKFVEIYFTKESKGAGYARNIGLKYVKGKWILFADADDFFLNNAFENLYSQINYPFEIVYFKVQSCYSDMSEPANRGSFTKKYIENFIDNRNNAEDLIRYKHPVPWGKMIKIELIRRENIRFDEVAAGNDAMFSLLIGHHASAITAIDEFIYCSTINKGSITNTMSLDNLTAKYFVTLRYNDFLKKHNKKRYQSFMIYYFLFVSLKYGIKVFFKFLKLAVRYGSNPFMDINRCIYNIVLMYKEKKKKKKYFYKK